MDTAKNIVEYIRMIHSILKPGAFWLNVGPLLYHYEDMSGEASLELSWNEVRHIIVQAGFAIQSEDCVQTTYATNQLSMFQSHYNCIRFTAQKSL